MRLQRYGYQAGYAGAAGHAPLTTMEQTALRAVRETCLELSWPLLSDAEIRRLRFVRWALCVGRAFTQDAQAAPEEAAP